jgi:hypothetical protein
MVQAVQMEYAVDFAFWDVSGKRYKVLQGSDSELTSLARLAFAYYLSLVNIMLDRNYITTTFHQLHYKM